METSTKYMEQEVNQWWDALVVGISLENLPQFPFNIEQLQSTGTSNVWEIMAMINVDKLPGASILKTELGISWMFVFCCIFFVAGTSTMVRLMLSTLAVTTGLFLATQQHNEIWYLFVMAGMGFCLSDIIQCMETRIYISLTSSMTKRNGIFRMVGMMLMLCVYVPLWTIRQLYTISVFSVFPALLVASRMPKQDSYPDLNIYNVLLTLAGLDISLWSQLDVILFAFSILCLETMRRTITWMCTSEKNDDHYDQTCYHELTYVLPIREHSYHLVRTPSRGDFESGQSTPCYDSDGATPPTPHTGNAIVNHCYFYRDDDNDNDDNDNDNDEDAFSPLSPDSTIAEGNVDNAALMQAALWSPSPGTPAVDCIVSPWMVVLGNNNHQSPLSDTTSISKKLQIRKRKIRTSGDGLEQQFEQASSTISTLPPVRSRATSLVDQTVETMKSVVTPVYYEFEHVAAECHRAMSKSGIFTSSSSSKMIASMPTTKETNHHQAITLGVKVVEPQEWDTFSGSGYTSMESRNNDDGIIIQSTVSKSFSDDEIGRQIEVVVRSRIDMDMTV